MDQFESFPYQESALSLTYRTNAGTLITSEFQTGLIVYIVETGRIYLMGKNTQRQNSVIPLDRVLLEQIKVLPAPNLCYHTDEFYRMYREMFQLSMEEPVHVRVRFSNAPFVAEKLKRLRDVRPDAKMEENPDAKEIIYTDTIRGEGDFSRYLRRFGRAVIVDEPASLRERMIDSSRRIIALYEEEEDEQS